MIQIVLSRDALLSPLRRQWRASEPFAIEILADLGDGGKPVLLLMKDRGVRPAEPGARAGQIRRVVVAVDGGRVTSQFRWANDTWTHTTSRVVWALDQAVEPVAKVVLGLAQDAATASGAYVHAHSTEIRAMERALWEPEALRRLREERVVADGIAAKAALAAGVASMVAEARAKLGG